LAVAVAVPDLEPMLGGLPGAVAGEWITRTSPRSIAHKKGGVMRRVSTVAALCLIALVVGHLVVAAQTAAPARTSKVPAGTVVNINTATADQFDALPGIGAKMAARIVDYRQKNGSFKKLEDLMNVKGIGEKNFLKLKPLITIGQPKPVAASGQPQ
jgi:comEA protein